MFCNPLIQGSARKAAAATATGVVVDNHEVKSHSWNERTTTGCAKRKEKPENYCYYYYYVHAREKTIL